MNFRSKLEEMVSGVLGPEWDYEPFSVDYVTHRKYTPDFVYRYPDGQILVEVKGYFRPGDTQKYKAIRDQLAEDSMFDTKELVFFLSSPFKKVRKGGMINMSQWCDKEGFKWFVDGQDLKEYASGHI